MTAIQPLQQDKQLLEAISKEAPFLEFQSALRSAATRRYYPFALARYMRFHNFRSTYELINRDPKMIQADIAQYILSDNTVSRITMQTYVAVIKCFYIQNDILNINWKKLKGKLGTVEKKHHDQAYSIEQIRQILEQGCTDLRSKAIILLLASSGLRIGALAGLLIKHMQLYEKHGIYRFTVYPGGKDEYITFCSREAAATIAAYLDYRKRSGETLTPASPLFREQFDPEDKLRLSRPRQLDVNRLRKIVYVAIVRAGIRKIQPIVEGTRYGTIRHDVRQAHGFRKFFNTTLKNSDVKPLFVELWLGHKVGLEGAYFRPSDQDLLAEYTKAVDLLTISEEHRLQKEVAALQGENTVQRIRIGEKEVTITKLEAAMGEVKNLIEVTGEQQKQIDELRALLAAKEKEQAPVNNTGT